MLLSAVGMMCRIVVRQDYAGATPKIKLVTRQLLSARSYIVFRHSTAFTKAVKRKIFRSVAGAVVRTCECEKVVVAAGQIVREHFQCAGVGRQYVRLSLGVATRPAIARVASDDVDRMSARVVLSQLAVGFGRRRRQVRRDARQRLTRGQVRRPLLCGGAELVQGHVDALSSRHLLHRTSLSLFRSISERSTTIPALGQLLVISGPSGKRTVGSPNE